MDRLFDDKGEEEDGSDDQVEEDGRGQEMMMLLSDYDGDPPPKRPKIGKAKTHPPTRKELYDLVNFELKKLFLALMINDFNKLKHDKLYAPKQFGGKDRDSLDRYTFWPAHKDEIPLLYVAAHAILAGSGLSVSCERLNSATLRVITLLRNRLKDENKESLLLAMRAATNWDDLVADNAEDTVDLDATFATDEIEALQAHLEAVDATNVAADDTDT